MASAVSAVVGQNCGRFSVPPIYPTLTVEDVAANSLSHRHAQIDIQANAGDAHASVVLVLGEQEGVVVVVVMVPVARVPMAVCEARHSSGDVSCAVGDRSPIERARRVLRVWVCVWVSCARKPLCMCPRLQDAQLWAEDTRDGRVGRCTIQPVRLR
jgi:hypothetical protein